MLFIPNFAYHFSENDHILPEVKKTEKLHLATKGKKMDILKAIEVYKNSGDSITILLNDQTDQGKIPFFNNGRTFMNWAGICV